MADKKLKLSKKQKDVIRRMREGHFIWENLVTPGAKWGLWNGFGGHWGNIHGKVVSGVLPLLTASRYNLAVKKYELNELGKTIELD